MPNNLSGVQGRLYAQALQVLRRVSSIIPALTAGDHNVTLSPAQKGESVRVPLPASSGTVSDVVPASVAPEPGDSDVDSTIVELSNWKKVDCKFTEKEKNEVIAGIFPKVWEQRINDLVSFIITDLWGEVSLAYHFAGTAGSTPFASNLNEAAQAMAILTQNGVPMRSRFLLASPLAWANAIQVPALQFLQNSGDPDVLREGQIGRTMGYTWGQDAYLGQSTTGGTLSDGTAKQALVNGAVAPGAETANLDSPTLTGSLVIGDLFTVAGDTQQYVITQIATAVGNAITINFSPPVPADTPGWLDNAQVTFVETYTTSAIAMHSSAMVIASRPTPDSSLSELLGYTPKMKTQFTDPVTGLTLQMMAEDQYFQSGVTFSLLYGKKLLDGKRIVKILG